MGLGISIGPAVTFWLKIIILLVFLGLMGYRLYEMFIEMEISRQRRSGNPPEKKSQKKEKTEASVVPASTDYADDNIQKALSELDAQGQRSLVRALGAIYYKLQQLESKIESYQDSIDELLTDAEEP